MGSLNGDVMVMRNGRSTSQVSVYNYPEHLNPFYEDEQHKRLRFWKISKKDNEGRRNSFSIGNLKDMWAFKSFRLKKKSSTLGVNKTSESPPQLRRDYVIDNGCNTFDHRLRGSTTSSINGDSFQRNATYRSSLQTLPTNNDRIGLNRNDGYRSTIQVPRSNPRYQSPQQKQLHQQQTMGVSQQNRRSSQSSLVSTNPFESEDDDENEDINTSGIQSVNGGSTTTLTSRTQRKKRRAPAPPTPIHGRSNGVPPPIIRIESSHDSNHEELHIDEDLDIANLTAEIESFVKTKDNDEVEVTLKKEETTKEKPTQTAEVSSPKVEREIVKTEIKEVKETIPASKETTKTTSSSSSSTIVTQSSTQEQLTPAAKTNGQVTTVIVTTKTTTKSPNSDVSKHSENAIDKVQVTNEIVSKTEENKEIKSNGAIPKKPANIDVKVIETNEQQQSAQSVNNVTDLCIKENNKEELSSKPVPVKRQTKPETEVGHVECIHVHVESPRAKPRNEPPSGVSSFKTNETLETNETITNKTPFVLTSPPTLRRHPNQQMESETVVKDMKKTSFELTSPTATTRTQQQTESEPVIKETVKIVGTANKRSTELNIKEESVKAKPEILVKPTLSPKPVTKDHHFAEIHKPTRKLTNSQNGHVRRVSRDELISTTIKIQEESKEEEKKLINKEVSPTITKSKGENREAEKILEDETVDSLTIVETRTSITTNGDIKPVEKEHEKDVRKVNFESSAVTNSSGTVALNEDRKREDEFDLLYRPKPANFLEWKQSSLAPLETNIPPEKRKSVKDIIESINRSQRLLNAAANKDFPALQAAASLNNSAAEPVAIHQTSQAPNNNNLNENLKILDEKQQEIQRLVEEMSPTSTNGFEFGNCSRATNSVSPCPSNCNNELAEAQTHDNNNEIFQKCKVKKEVYDYRETSPITSNLDWNPVPKPKRTKPGHD